MTENKPPTEQVPQVDTHHTLMAQPAKNTKEESPSEIATAQLDALVASYELSLNRPITGLNPEQRQTKEG
ncbi:MAG: hypothetical protein H6657_25455 [Ardenticatenaceae bacterium]|nr:hypothetical protein [Ardenticatenaceae bacterium]